MGIALGLIAVATWGVAYWVLPEPAMAVAFATPLVDRTDDPISYDHHGRMLLKLENRGTRPVRVDALSFSQTFATAGAELALPVTIQPQAHASLPVEIQALKPHWGQYELTATARVSNRRNTQLVSTIIVCDIAAHLNPEPALVQFGRVDRSATIPPHTIRLWSVASQPPEEDCQVLSLDPAVRVSLQPVQMVEHGRRFQWELRVEIDARQAQAEHRSQIEVRTKGDRPPVIIPVAGWVNE